MATAKDLDKHSSLFESNNDTECPICLETLKTPKGLPCFHTFCEACLHEHILKTHRDKDPVTFPCPCCQKELSGPNPNIPLTEWASQFPLNRFVISMMQIQAGPETKTRLCDPCERGGNTVTAKHWCCQCKYAFCDTCLQYHSGMKNNKSHIILPIKDMEQVSSYVSAVDECMDHEGQDLAYYCKTHEKLCCKFCLLSTHKECITHTFEEMAGIEPGLFDVEKMLVGLNDLDDRAKLAMIFHRNQKEALDTSRANLKHKVSKLVTTAKSKLEECQNRIECILNKMHVEKTRESTEIENQIKNFRRVLSTGQVLLSSVKDADDVAQKIRAIDKIKNQIREEIEKLKPYADEDKIIELTLNVSDVFEKLNTLEAVGELEVKEKQTGPYVKPLLNAAVTLSDPVNEKPNLERIRLVKQFEITTTENDRWFTGGVFLKDNRLVFADFRNKKIRLYDSSGKLIHQHQLNYTPFDVTVSDTSNKVLVSDTESAYLRTYIISETGIREGSSIKVSDIKSGIATLGDQILCSGGGKVEIINYRGSSLKVLEMGYSEYICVSKAKKQFYCTYDHTVSCTTMNGDEVFVYSHPELTYPKGMAMDNHGNLFICAYSSGNIHVVSEDGKQSVDIVSINVGKITQPYSIAFNSTGEKIFVASYKENEPIEIYEVKYD